MTWLRNNAVSVIVAIVTFAAGCGTVYAATESRIAVLEEKVQALPEIRNDLKEAVALLNRVCAKTPGCE